MTSLYDMIYEINNLVKDIHFEKIEGFSIIGDIRSGAYEHPIQYRAVTNSLPGMDEPFEGVGWTPSEAVRSLLKELKKDQTYVSSDE